MKNKLGSQSAFLNPRVLIGMLFLAGLLLGLFAFDAFPGSSARAQGSRQNSKSGALHKVSVSDPGLAQTLKSQGGRVIADYGSFVLLEVSGEAASRLKDNPNAQILDESNLVWLNTGAIDTKTPEAQAMRSARSTKSGKQMRLIQFAGPIRPEWYEALVATGAHIVTSIPCNAYLVYGTAQTLQAVQTLASNESIVQWDGDYTAANRLDPAITGTTGTRRNLSAQGNEQFTIHMVEDATENAATMALIEQFKLEPIMKHDSLPGYFNVTVALPRDTVIHQIAERGDVISIELAATPTATPTPPPTVCNLTEGFDNITTLVPGGWVMQNNSQPGPGLTGWLQGNPTAFTSQSGAPNSFIAANFNNGTGTSTLSNWLLTPPVTLQNGAQLTFWTRTVTDVTFPDRLQVRMSTNECSSEVGNAATSVGDFTTLLLDINPTLTTTGYPTAWTQITVTITGLAPMQMVKGRLAFRYLAGNAGPGMGAFYIGIDAVEYHCNGVIVGFPRFIGQ